MISCNWGNTVFVLVNHVLETVIKYKVVQIWPGQIFFFLTIINRVAQLLRSAACLHTNQSRSYLNHLLYCTLIHNTVSYVWLTKDGVARQMQTVHKRELWASRTAHIIKCTVVILVTSEHHPIWEFDFGMNMDSVHNRVHISKSILHRHAWTHGGIKLMLFLCMPWIRAREVTGTVSGILDLNTISPLFVWGLVIAFHMGQ
jgi:hypothetical protein